MNRLGRRSPAMHEVEGKTPKFLEKLKITSRTSNIFGHFFGKYFQITCVDICISLIKNNNTPIHHTCLTLCWSCFHSTTGHSVVSLLFWVMQVKKQKTIASSWFHEKLSLLETSRESRKAALRKSHRLSRCQIVLTKRCHYNYYCHYCHYYCYHNFSFEFCHNFTF